MVGTQDNWALSSVRSGLSSQEEEPGSLPHKHSFGFGVAEHEDHTSSDGEPGVFRGKFTASLWTVFNYVQTRRQHV